MSTTSTRIPTTRPVPTRLLKVIDDTDTRPVDMALTSAARTVLLSALTSIPAVEVRHSTEWQRPEHYSQLNSEAINWLGYNHPISQRFMKAASADPILSTVRDSVGEMYDRASAYHADCVREECSFDSSVVEIWGYHYSDEDGYSLTIEGVVVPGIDEPSAMVEFILGTILAHQHSDSVGKRSYDDNSRHFAAGL